MTPRHQNVPTAPPSSDEYENETLLHREPTFNPRFKVFEESLDPLSDPSSFKVYLPPPSPSQDQRAAMSSAEDAAIHEWYPSSSFTGGDGNGHGERRRHSARGITRSTTAPVTRKLDWDVGHSTATGRREPLPSNRRPSVPFPESIRNWYRDRRRSSTTTTTTMNAEAAAAQEHVSRRRASSSGVSHPPERMTTYRSRTRPGAALPHLDALGDPRGRSVPAHPRSFQPRLGSLFEAFGSPRRHSHSVAVTAADEEGSGGDEGGVTRSELDMWPGRSVFGSPSAARTSFSRRRGLRRLNTPFRIGGSSRRSSSGSSSKSPKAPKSGQRRESLSASGQREGS